MFITKPYREYTTADQDRLIDNLDLRDSTVKAIEEVLERVAQEAFSAGYKQCQEDHQ